LFLLSIAVFLFVHIAPGDPITTMAGPGATEEQIHIIQAQYHLNLPLPNQYLLWISHVVTGDFGRSIQTGQPVTQIIQERFAVTAALALITTILVTVTAIPLGALAAVFRGRMTDLLITIGTSLALSFPNFLVALVLIVVVGVSWQILPIAGFQPLNDHPLQALRYMVLPVISLGLAYLALLTRMVRSEMVEALRQDFIRTARAKGVSGRRVILYHALRNAILPAVSLVMLNFAFMLGGSVIIENIFALPGLGSMIVNAVLARDFPVVQGITIVYGVTFVLSSIVADLLSMIADPRVAVS
jgi:peptide/nickel transport system permease protein